MAQRFQLFGSASSCRARGSTPSKYDCDFLRAAFGDAPGFGVAAVEGDDDVVLAAAAQRIVDEVAIGPAPHHRRVELEVLGKLRRVDDRAVDDVSRHARGVADELLPHGGLAAVAGDERVGAIPPPCVSTAVTLRASCWTRSTCADVVTSMRASSRTASSSDWWTSARWITAYGLPKRARNIVAERHVGDLAPVDGVVQHHPLGVDGAGARAVADAERVEGGEGVGTELHAGADLAQLGHLLQHAHAHALARERKRRGKAADAAAGDQDRRRRRIGRVGVGHGKRRQRRA